MFASEQHESPGYAPYPPKKRVARTRLVGGSRRSSRRQDVARPKDLLSTLNFDVLIYLCTFLCPAGLLNLSRTSKAFRQFLFSKSSISIWKGARSQVEGLPECPPDLNEPQYACLAFDRHCYKCGKIGQHLFWQFRARYCSPCVKTCTTTKRRLSDLVNRLIGESYCLPMIKEGKKRIFHTRDTEALRDKVQDMRVREVEAYLKERGQTTHTIEEHARRCDIWYQSVRDQHAADTSTAWEMSIRSWLIENGWEDEVNCFAWETITKPSALRTPKSLTTRTFSTITKPLGEWMENLRNVRIELTVYSPRRLLLIEAYSALLRMKQRGGEISYELMPHVVDVAAFQPIKDIINSPSNTVITTRDFLAAFAQLPGLVDEWRRKVDRELVEACICNPTPYPIHYPTAAIVARLRLAATVFTHSSRPTFMPVGMNYFVPSEVRRMLLYPDVLAYSTFIEPDPLDLFKSLDPTSIAHKVMGGRPWSIRTDVYQPPKIRFYADAAHIIRACGMDPLVATVDDMNRLDPRLRCNVCILIKSETCVMSWRTAIHHAITVHDDGMFRRYKNASQFTLVTSEEELQTRILEGKLETFDGDNDSYICQLCWRSVGDAKKIVDMLSHIQHSHQIPTNQIKLGVHYSPDPTFVPHVLAPVVLESAKPDSSVSLLFAGPEMQSVAPSSSASLNTFSLPSGYPFTEAGTSDNAQNSAVPSQIYTSLDSLVAPPNFDSLDDY